MSWENRVDQLLKDGNSVYESGKVIHRECFPEEPEARIIERVRGYVRRRNERIGRTSISDATDTVEHIVLNRNDDGSFLSERLIKIALADMKNPDSVMLAHGFNPIEWEMVSCKNNLWSMNSSEEDKVNCQSKITVKPRKNPELTEQQIKELFDTLDRQYAYSKPLIVKRGANNIAVINIVDMHLAKMAWRGDTRNDYDLKIAQNIWAQIVSDIYTELIQRKDSIEYILFNWAHDFFHVDNQQNTTTHGTPQDVDGRLTKMFRIGCEMLVKAIDSFCDIAPVKTFWCKSNHDTVHGYHALCFLEAWYRENANVEVNYDAYPRKYYEYGNNLIGFSHGSDEKKKNLPMLMPLEEPEAWGRTKYRYFELSHLHSEQATEEMNGILVERLSSPTASDAWHIDSGYVGATRKATTHIYNKETGRKYTIQTVVEE